MLDIDAPIPFSSAAHYSKSLAALERAHAIGSIMLFAATFKDYPEFEVLVRNHDIGHRKIHFLEFLIRPAAGAPALHREIKDALVACPPGFDPAAALAEWPGSEKMIAMAQLFAFVADPLFKPRFDRATLGFQKAWNAMERAPNTLGFVLDERASTSIHISGPDAASVANQLGLPQLGALMESHSIGKASRPAKKSKPRSSL